MTLDLAAKILEGGEDECRRVARELHDDIGQRIALLADDADRLRRELAINDDANRQRLDNLVLQARELSEDLRRISHALHPAILEDLGLVPAIRSLTDDFAERTGMQIKLVDLDIPRDLPLGTSTTLYRITQEALRNILKHAGRTTVQITLGRALGEVVLAIKDYGVGFDPADESTGLGITCMRERAHIVGGTLTITSVPAKGTTIRVHVPFAKGHAQ